MYTAALLLGFLMIGSPIMLIVFGYNLYKKIKDKKQVTEADITIIGMNIILFIVFLIIFAL